MPHTPSGIRYRGTALEDFTHEELVGYVVMSKAQPFVVRAESVSLSDLVRMSKLVHETGRLAPEVPWKAQGAA